MAESRRFRLASGVEKLCDGTHRCRPSTSSSQPSKPNDGVAPGTLIFPAMRTRVENLSRLEAWPPPRP